MFRGISKKNIVALLVIALVLGGVVRYGFNTFAYSGHVNLQIHISPAGSGTVTGPGINCPSGCSASFLQSGSSGKYTAKATSGYTFTGWENNPSARSGMDYKTNPNFSISQATSWNFTANFIKNPAPAPAPTPAPTPIPTPTPADDTYVDNGGDSGGETIVSEPTDTSTPDTSGETTDTQAPTIPANLQGTFDKDQNSISLSWDETTDDTGVSGYEVQRQEKGGTSWETVGNVATGEFTDFQFSPSKTYEYQVRSYDDAKNYSAWSTSAEVVSGEFKANVTAADGGSVTDSNGVVTVEVPKGAVNADLVILINKVNIKGLTLTKNTKLVGSYYDIKAKDSQGNEVKKFDRQIIIKFNYKKINTAGVSKSTLAIATALDASNVEVLKTSLDSTNATTLTDHLSIYFLAAEKTGIWVTLLWILLWLMVIGGVIAGGYFGWKRYQLYQYQKEHKEDFIYKH